MGSFVVSTKEMADLAEQDLGVSEWLEVSRDQVQRFADATLDHQWIHLDEERARNGPFGTTIAHGYLTLALVPRLLDSVLSISDEVRGVNYGLERVRFTAPVPVGSAIRLAVRFVMAETRPDGAIRYRLKLEVQLEGGDRPVMVAEALYLSYSS
ncbi:MaoC family dehydratase [Nocardioides acrostichi]|uniref:MaoC family dehydratase n=1 Tax=Nocardioides acrostichi TaxID=2784339 RepID=A0A930YBU1_9ACTN|nr:MaoC family dehydratase [Nocardioides acrostichi]MBF4160809.1 MaoC family dehydratase [Nocardioides acrostichi]